jgi:uncharacterized membrane protein YgaE (UPF0421/DUF939 family)
VKIGFPLLRPADLDRRTVLNGIQLALRAGIASAVAFAIAGALKLNFPIFAAVAAIIVTDLAPAQSRALGLHRIVATILGAGCGGMLSVFLPQQSWALGTGIAFAMLITSLVQGKEGVKVAGFTCGIIIVNMGANPWHFALDRLMETLVGIVVAWAVSHIPKLLRLPEPEEPEP